MNKLTSLLIAGVSIAMGSFVAMPAQALAYIVDNPRPGKCTLIENDIVKKEYSIENDTKGNIGVTYTIALNKK